MLHVNSCFYIFDCSATLVLSFPTGVCFHYKLLTHFVPFCFVCVYKKTYACKIEVHALVVQSPGTIFLSHATLWALMGSVSLSPMVSNNYFNYFSFKPVSNTWSLKLFIPGQRLKGSDLYIIFFGRGSIHYLMFSSCIFL